MVIADSKSGVLHALVKENEADKGRLSFLTTTARYVGSAIIDGKEKREFDMFYNIKCNSCGFEMEIIG